MTVTPAPVVPDMPPAPNRFTDNGEAYTEKANATMAAFPATIDGINDAAAATEANAEAAETAATSAEGDAAAATAAASAAVNATAYVRNSTDSLTIGTGAKDLTNLNTPSAAAFANGDEAYIIRRGDRTARMRGTVSLANMPAGTMRVTIGAGAFSGAGTFTDWLVMHADLASLADASVADVRAGTNALLAVSPKTLQDAAAFQALTAGTNIGWDASLGFNAKVTLAGAANNMSAPTNLVDGLTYTLFLKQDATGGRTVTAWNAIFDWAQSGPPTLSTGAGKVDQVFGVYSADTGKLHVNFRRAA